MPATGLKLTASAATASAAASATAASAPALSLPGFSQHPTFRLVNLSLLYQLHHMVQIFELRIESSILSCFQCLNDIIHTITGHGNSETNKI